MRRTKSRDSGGPVVQLLIRFFLGGALVATLPIIAQRFGAAIAGVVLLYPAVSFAGLLFLGQSQGVIAVATASLSAVFGLPTVLAFLLTVHVAARRGLPLPVILAAGTISWFAIAIPISGWNRRRLR